MKTYRIVSIIVCILTLGLIVGLPFAFKNEPLTEAKTVFIFYLISKIVFGLLFLGVVIYGLVSEKARGSYYPIVALALIMQFVPLTMRTYISLTTFQLGMCLITLIVSLIICAVVVGVLPSISKRQLESEKKSAGKEIEVKSDLPDKF